MVNRQWKVILNDNDFWVSALAGLATIKHQAFADADLRGLTSLPSGMTIQSLQMDGAMLSGLINSPSM